MIKYHHQVDISEHCFSTASIFLIKWVISNSFSQHEKFVFSLVHIHRCQGDGIPPPFHSIQPPPPNSIHQNKRSKNRECGGECGELEGVPSPSNRYTYLAVEGKQQFKIAQTYQNALFGDSCEYEGKSIAEKNTQPALPLTSASFQPANMRSMNSMTNFYMTCTAFKWKKTIVLFVLK